MLQSAKPIASLSSGLLARKGQARPAMRPAGFDEVAAVPDDHDDLGWNDMGTPMPPVLVQREALRGITKAPEVPVATRISADTFATIGRQAARDGKAAFTLRLDADRHLRLRLAGAITGRSSQAIVTQALDAFLMTLPQVEELVRQLPGQPADRLGD